jgi:hypothetical protein
LVDHGPAARSRAGLSTRRGPPFDAATRKTASPTRPIRITGTAEPPLLVGPLLMVAVSGGVGVGLWWCVGVGVGVGVASGVGVAEGVGLGV